MTDKKSTKIPPKPGKETVYLDVDDEITSVIDKVEAAKEKVVALVLPKRATTFQSIVNMRLLKRSAEKAGKNVVLITSEGALLPLAGAAGLHVAKNLQSAPVIPDSPESAEKVMDHPEEADLDTEPDAKDAKLDYHRAVGELAAAHAIDEAIDLDEGGDETTKSTASKKSETPKDKKLKVPNFDRFRYMTIGGIGALGLLIIFIILALFVLPHATIALKTTSTPVSANLALKADPNAKSLDEVKNIIPSSLKTSDQTNSQQVQATGQQNNGDKATGTITISGGACGPTVPSDIPAGTGANSNGLVFITQKTASFSPTVQGGKCTFQSNQVGVIAQSAGSKYNGQTSFSVAGYSASGQSTSGGTDNNVTILSQADVDKAKQKITSADSDNFSKKFQQDLNNQGMYVIASTLKINDPVVTASPSVGQPASTANVTTKITYTVLTVPKSDLRKAVTDELNKQIDKTKQKLSESDILNGLSVTVQSQPTPDSANLAINKDGTAIPIIHDSLVKAQIKGKKTAQVKEILTSYPGVKDVDVNLSPFWVSKVPKKEGKIKIVVQPLKESQNGG